MVQNQNADADADTDTDTDTDIDADATATAYAHAGATPPAALPPWRPTRAWCSVGLVMNPVFETPMPTLSLRRITDTEFQIPGADPWYADRQDPALTVMTDFRERSSVTVSDAAAVDVALEHMRHNGVRCAFAVDEPRRTVVGLTTAYDIMGEKAMQSAHTPRREVLVRDIMLKIAEWRVLTVVDLENATVGSLERLFDKSGLTHIPVMEAIDGEKYRLRGLLSAAKTRRLLSR